MILFQLKERFYISFEDKLKKACHGKCVMIIYQFMRNLELIMDLILWNKIFVLLKLKCAFHFPLRLNFRIEEIYLVILFQLEEATEGKTLISIFFIKKIYDFFYFNMYFFLNRTNSFLEPQQNLNISLTKQNYNDTLYILFLQKNQNIYK